MGFLGFLSEMMDAVRTYCLLLHVHFWRFCFLLPSALKCEISHVTLKANFFLRAAFVLSAVMGLLPSKQDLTIVFLWKKLHAVLVVMTAGGLTAFTGVKNKQCLRTNSRLQRLSVKEVLSPLLKATLSQVKESKRTGNQTHDLFFFPPEEMVFKIWEIFVLDSDFFQIFSCIH